MKAGTRTCLTGAISVKWRTILPVPRYDGRQHRLSSCWSNTNTASSMRTARRLKMRPCSIPGEFDFSVDERGYSDNDWDQVIVEANWDVAFGDGTLTNIFGWRDYALSGLVDVDGTPRFLFHSTGGLEQEQYSNEFRYAGRFGGVLALTGWCLLFHPGYCLPGNAILAGDAGFIGFRDGI